MATADRVKEEIGLLKLFLAALIAIDVSLIAWLAQNYTRANRLLVLAAVATTLMIAVLRYGSADLCTGASNGWKTFNLWYGLL
jgi:heme/copper-type cytochrome/quinol oxidase subunit 4